MATQNKEDMGITTIYLMKPLKDAVDEFNKQHPNRKINKSGIAREAIQKELTRRKGEEL